MEEYIGAFDKAERRGEKLEARRDMVIHHRYTLQKCDLAGHLSSNLLNRNLSPIRCGTRVQD